MQHIGHWGYSTYTRGNLTSTELEEAVSTYRAFTAWVNWNELTIKLISAELNSWNSFCKQRLRLRADTIELLRLANLTAKDVAALAISASHWKTSARQFPDLTQARVLPRLALPLFHLRGVD